MLKEKFKKELDNLKNIINIRKINNIRYNIVNIESKDYLIIDKIVKNLTDEKKIFIIKSVLNEVKNSKLITHYNNYFLFELEEESTNANN